MKTIKIMIMLLSLSGMYQFAYAQPNCHGDNVLMSKGIKGSGCGGCKQKCVPTSEVQTYLAAGWYYGECFKCNNNWVRTDEAKRIKETRLTEVYPNSVQGSVTIAFNLVQESDVTIKISDMTGRYVATVTNESFANDDNELIWDDSGLKSGVYFLTMEAGPYSETKKISVMN
ncbi:MAG: T9SS type A sorting domain-containing protein [Saprospiraceae bacterium]